jgi:hypothetical protein
MAQVHAAVAYYWSHQSEILQDIENEESWSPIFRRMPARLNFARGSPN